MDGVRTLKTNTRTFNCSGGNHGKRPHPTATILLSQSVGDKGELVFVGQCHVCGQVFVAPAGPVEKRA